MKRFYLSNSNKQNTSISCVKSSWTSFYEMHKQIKTWQYFQSIEIASMKEVRKVKSVQMFKRPVQRASQGDRIGMCVTQFDAKLLERGISCAPGYVTTIHGCVIDMGRSILH